MKTKKMSCFNFISCGGRGDNHDEFVQSKSSEKPKWNFGKRSKKHPGLTTNSSLEPASKENAELKTGTVYSEEKHVDNVHSVLDKDVSPAVDESRVVLIQAYIRGYLARRERRRIKSAIKLQSAMRGHMERRKAVGSLRSIQALVRIQSLVRARYSRDDEQGEDSGEKNSRTLSPTEKLLSNAFARQLLKSASRSKSINLRCDPMSSDSTWKWMERWMSVYAPDAAKKNETIEAETHHDILEENTEIVVEHDSKLELGQSLVANENATNTQSENTSAFEFQASAAVSVANDNLSAENDMKDSDNKEVAEKVVDAQRSDGYLLSGSCVDNACLDSSSEPKCISPQHSTREESYENLETCDKMHLMTSRKLSSLPFTAELEFGELSSPGTGWSVNYDKGLVQSSESENNPNELNLGGESVSCDPVVQVVAALERVTELPVESLARPETNGTENTLEVGVSDKDDDVVSDAADKTSEPQNLDANGEMPLTDTDSVQSQSHEKGDGTLTSSITLVDLAQIQQHKYEQTASDMQANVESVVDPENKPSPAGTPKSQANVSDLHGTPSSQVSVTSKKNKKDEKDRKLASQKTKTQLTERKSPTNKSSDSGGRGSMGDLSKDAKNSNRQNSSRISKHDLGDQKTSSVPSYMQATVSARAKAQANVSPKSSPDVHESQKKMRHSLAAESGKKGSSPQMQRSTSVQKNSKVGVHSSPNLAEERRWQR